MKTSTSNIWKPVWTSLFVAVMALRTAADEAPSAASAPSTPEKSYTGTVVSLNNNDHLLRLKGWFSMQKSFNLGDNCVYYEPGSGNAPINALRPGEKVKVNYQDRHGVLIADRVQQIPMHIEGMITKLDATNHMLTVHQTPLNEQFRLPDDCRIVLRDGKSGTLDDIKIGSYVTVTYETPNDKATAREIAQTSQEFTGTLTAIDLDERTVKAKAVFGSKEFHLADQCAVMNNGQPNGRLADLRPEEKLVFSYDDINGVNVVNRIAPEKAATKNVATTSPPQGE